MGDKIRFAIVGDVHGEQNLMYDLIDKLQSEHGEIQAILQVGDFETIRKFDDLQYYYAPQKYHKISDLAEYWEGIRKASVPTVFIAGNHEAWGVLEGKSCIAPDIFFLGRSGTIEICGKKIGGLGGLYRKKHYELDLPKTPDDTWKFYRRKDAEKLAQSDLDILLLHEWPSLDGFEVVNGCGRYASKIPTPANMVIDKTSPCYVFAGHHHKEHVEAERRHTKFIGLRKLGLEKSIYLCEFNE